MTERSIPYSFINSEIEKYKNQMEYELYEEDKEPISHYYVDCLTKLKQRWDKCPRKESAHISLKWLQKAILEMRYSNEINAESYEAFRKVLARWARENGHS